MTVDDNVLSRMMHALATPPSDDVPTLSRQSSFESESSYDKAPALAHQDGVWYCYRDCHDISTDSIRHRPFDFAHLHTDPDVNPDTSAVALAVTSDIPQEPLHRVAHKQPGYVSALQYRRSTAGERGSNARASVLSRFGAKLAGMWRPESPQARVVVEAPNCDVSQEVRSSAQPVLAPAPPEEHPKTPLATQIARRRSTNTTPPRRKPVPSQILEPAAPVAAPLVPAPAMLAPPVRADDSTIYANALSADESIVAGGAMVGMPAGSKPARHPARPPPRPPKSALRAVRALPMHSPVPSLSEGSDESDVEVIGYAVDEDPLTSFVDGLAISLPRVEEKDDHSNMVDESYTSLF
jgi:hypothetical protein